MKIRIFLLMIFVLSIFSLHAQKRTMSPEDLWRMGRVSDIQLSPDGKTVLYGVTQYDLKNNSGDRNLFTLSVKGGTPELITNFKGSEYNGVWSSDGKTIGFISSENGSSQIWETTTDGKIKRAISDEVGGITGFSYSPSGDKVLFVKSVKLENTPRDIYSDLPDNTAKIFDDLMYRHWDSWHDYAYNHIFIADYQKGKISNVKDIMSNERYDSPMNPWGGMEQIDWSPDGSYIAYTCKKLKGKEYAVSTNSEIWLYNTKTGKTRNLSQGNDGYDQDPDFSPDGENLVWRSMETPGFEADKDRIFVYNFKTSKITDYSLDFDQSASAFEWSDDGKTLYFISAHHGTHQIYSLVLESKEIRPVTTGRHDYQEICFGGKYLIATKMAMDMPTEIFRVDIKNGKEMQLTQTNERVLSELEMGRVEERWIETTDGKKMLVWVIYPPFFNPEKKYPALLYCQGGPQSTVSQFWSYRWNFQMMAAGNCIVVAPNRRGTPSFGQEWVDQISGDYGGQNMQDYLSAIDALAEEPYVDADNLAAAGASYGGYSVFWLAGNHDKRFKAFISHCGIYDFYSMYGSTEEYFFVNHDYEGPFWKTPEPKSYTFSPHLFVKNWDTPILIISGANDFRIPYTQSLEAFNAAQLLGVPSRLLFFPDESHFVLKPQNSVLWQREFALWLETWLNAGQ
ncbi:MAG TPA: S9 family peptidase [Bacteroidales bacterium]|nr:S9 family peptidase [Bacteroidales bacterium]HPE86111.1 S9 family peptidase [Bacteroidales bacterium]